MTEKRRVAWLGERGIVVEGVPTVNRANASAAAVKDGEEKLTHPTKGASMHARQRRPQHK